MAYHKSQLNHIINPLNGEMVAYGGATYQSLVEDGHIQVYRQQGIVDRRSRSEKRKGVPIFDLPPGQLKYCCAESKCHLKTILCCIHGDMRELIKAGRIIYALRSTYIDGVGNCVMLDYAWRDYCPDCISKSRRDQGIKDIRQVTKEHRQSSDENDLMEEIIEFETTEVEIEH